MLNKSKRRARKYSNNVGGWGFGGGGGGLEKKKWEGEVLRNA